MSRAVIGMPAGMAPAFAGRFGGFGAVLGHLVDHGTDRRAFPAPGDRRTR
ncbi:hypothetical protein [Streptomyces sp. NPDC020571]